MVRNLPANAQDEGSIPGLGRSLGEGNGYPLQYSPPGKSHGQRSVAGYSPWGCKESDTTKKLTLWASLVAQTIKNLLAMQETRVRSLGREEPLEKGMATHSSILAWRIPWTEDPEGLQYMGSQRVRHN